MDQVKFFKGCLPQTLLGPFLNTLSDIFDKSLNKFFFGSPIVASKINNKASKNMGEI